MYIERYESLEFELWYLPRKSILSFQRKERKEIIPENSLPCKERMNAISELPFPKRHVEGRFDLSIGENATIRVLSIGDGFLVKLSKPRDNGRFTAEKEYKSIKDVIDVISRLSRHFLMEY